MLRYVPKLIEIQGSRLCLVGWSLGGVLAYACAIGLRRLGKDVRGFVGLIDAVRAGEIPPDQGGSRKRWDRYAAFAEGVQRDHPNPVRNIDDEGQVRFVLDAVSQSGVQIRRDHRTPTHVVSGQPGDRHRPDPAVRRACRPLHDRSRYHDDAIMFNYLRVRQPDGRWGERFRPRVVPIGGEHIQAIGRSRSSPRWANT